MIHRLFLYRPAVNPGASRAKSAYINLTRCILRIYVIISFFEKNDYDFDIETRGTLFTV